MPAFITGARLKAERAEIHLKELKTMVDSFLNDDPNFFRRQLNPQNLDNYIYEFFPQVAPPLTIAVVLGDIAHNLRSALDHIAWQLALANPDLTKEPYRATAFPIVNDTSSGSIDQFKRLTQSVLPDAIRAIEAVQPYHRGDAAEFDELALLHLIWNEDKHRLLTTITGRLTVPVFTGTGGSFRELDDGTKLVEIPRSAEPEKYFEPGISREVLFEMPRATRLRRHAPLVSLIEGIYYVVASEIVPLFARFLPESGDLVIRRQGFVQGTH